MSITVTGAVMIAYAVYLFLTSSTRQLFQTFIFFASFSATAVLNFNNYGMSPGVLFFTFLVLTKLSSGDAMRPVRISRDHLVPMLLLMGFALVSVTSLLINEATHPMLAIQRTQTIYIVFGAIVTFVVSIHCSRFDRLEHAIHAFRAGATFISLWGLLQVLCFYAGVEYPAIIFNNSNSHYADLFEQQAGGNVVRIASVATEPSFMSSSLMISFAFGVTLLAIEPRFRTRGWVIPIGIILFTAIASTSTTAYTSLVVLILLMALRRPGLTVAITAFSAMAGAVLLSLLPSFADAMYRSTFGKAGTSSYSDRATATAQSIQVFLEHPLLGVGWGGIFSYSMVTTVLTGVGLIGTALFIAAILATLLSSRGARRASLAPDQWRLRAYASAAENALIVYLGQSVFSGFRYVVADFWCLWAVAIAIPSCLACAHLPADRLPLPATAPPATRRLGAASSA